MQIERETESERDLRERRDIPHDLTGNDG